MRKYQEVSKLTNEYLQGTLMRMEFDYENEADVVVSISYEDKHKSKMDYVMKIHNLSSVDFLAHQGRDTFGKFPLRREEAFENALADYLVKA